MITLAADAADFVTDVADNLFVSLINEDLRKQSHSPKRTEHSVGKQSHSFWRLLRASSVRTENHNRCVSPVNNSSVTSVI